MPTFSSSGLAALARRIVERMGSIDEEAREVADHLVRANLAGHDSHGVGMLPSYVRIWRDGLLIPNQILRSVVDAGAVMVLDGGRGFGQRMAAEAVRRAIVRARETGVCVVALRNSAHIGRVGTYGELAARSGMAFTAFVNVADDPPWQAPWGCRDPKLGTNPFCVAVPTNDEPMLLDMATTTIAFGKARVAANKGTPVPEDAVIDSEGNPTADPTRLVREHEGALRSFGRHKGSGLAVMCEVMAAAVTGGQRADQPKRNGILNSMLATVVDLRRLGDADQIRRDVASVGDNVRSSPPAPGFDQILLPGDPERRSAAQRLAAGIPIDETSWAQIREAATSIGIIDAEIDAALAARE